MEENWCSLAICILIPCTPEQAFEMYVDGKKHNQKLSNQDYDDIEKYRQMGVTWKELGCLFHMKESSIFKCYKRHKERIAV